MPLSSSASGAAAIIVIAVESAAGSPASVYTAKPTAVINKPIMAAKTIVTGKAPTASAWPKAKVA